MEHLFRYNQREVRTLEIEGQIWFIAKDVCDILEINNVSQAVTRLDEDERDIISNDTPSGKQEMNIINESGLYSLILSSRKSEAKPFRNWVTREVLPSIRQTGSYALEQPKTKLEMIAEGFVQIARIEREHNQLQQDHGRLEGRHDVLEERHDILEVKVGTLIEDKNKAEAELIALPIADEPPAPKTVRAKINELVRAYAHATSLSHIAIWGKLYHELKYRYSFDLKARQRHQPNKKPLDIIEEEGYLNELFKVASRECQIRTVTRQ